LLVEAQDPRVFAMQTSLQCALGAALFAAISCLPSSLFAAEIRGNVVGSRGEVDFYAVGGQTLYELVHPATAPGPNDLAKATDDLALARIGWRWAVDPRLLVEAHGAYFHQPSSESNGNGQLLGEGRYAEWVAAGSTVWSWRKDETLEGGWMARRVSTGSKVNSYFPPSSLVESDANTGEGWKNDGYVQQSSAFFGNRVNLAGGLRLDTAALFDVHPLSPQISAAWQVASATQLQLGYGRYHQFDFPANAPFEFSTTCAQSVESLETANHYVAAIEQRVGESTRVKLLLFDRSDEFSFDNSASAGCPAFLGTRGFQTSGRDYSRGAQIVLQSRTVNRLSGWIGYTLAYARQASYGSGTGPIPGLSWSPYYPTLADQRNTLNLFTNYRLTPTVNLGGKFLFGSGYPVPSG
jgi:hypothetical protein